MKDMTSSMEIRDEEGLLLYDLARKCRGRGVIVEIGSWKGKSTIFLAQGSKMGNKTKVYAIDPHRRCTFPEFQENIRQAKVDDIVTPLVMTSKAAAQNFQQPVELIFIDGSHEYDLVKLDFDLWFPKLVEGGIMVFHDTLLYPGPRRIVRKFLFNSRQFKNIGLVCALVFGREVRNNSLMDVLRNQCFLFLHYIEQIVAGSWRIVAGSWIDSLILPVWQAWMKIKQRKIQRSFKL